MKTGICTAVGVVGGFIASLFGGWDAAYEKHFADGGVFDRIYEQ